MARMTKQKRLLTQALANMSSFFDAYELHEKVKQNIGIATVYRFLKSLEEQGQIHSFMCENSKIYSTNSKSHAHFTCENCGRKEHVVIKNAHFLRSVIKRDVCHFQLDMHGVCQNCKKK